MGNGKWKMENGKWKMEMGNGKMEKDRDMLQDVQLHTPYSIRSRRNTHLKLITR